MRVRKLGSGALVWASGSLSGGEVGDVPVEVVRRYAHRLQVLEELPPEGPVVPDEVAVTPKVAPKARKRRKPRKSESGG